MLSETVRLFFHKSLCPSWNDFIEKYDDKVMAAKSIFNIIKYRHYDVFGVKATVRDSDYDDGFLRLDHFPEVDHFNVDENNTETREKNIDVLKEKLEELLEKYKPLY